LSKKANYFEARLAFSSAMEGVSSAQVQAQNKHSRACVKCEVEMNKRKLGSFALGVLLIALGFPVEAQQPKVAKIGWLGNRPEAARRDPEAARRGTALLQRMLTELGYVEGKNIAFEFRSGDYKVDRFPALADELVRLKVDLIVVSNSNAAQAAKTATRTIPIVFFGGGDPVAGGLVDSLARPGGNITGFTDIATVLSGKRLELLKETIPKLARVAVLWTPQMNPQQWKESQLAARELGLQLHSMEVSSADEYERAFKEAVKARSTALAVTRSSLNNSNPKKIVDLAAKNRLPAIYPRTDFVESGGLMSYGADQTEPYRRVALMIDKILKGTKPADLPVEQPTKFELMINLKTAKALGLTIPAVVMMRAEKVIK
jgi:putative ABC transport system substrate-binding protein